MAQHQQDHGAHQHKQAPTDLPAGGADGLRKDWRVWVAVLAMLAAIVVYVLSDDESIQPGDDAPQPEVPAAVDG